MLSVRRGAAGRGRNPRPAGRVEPPRTLVLHRADHPVEDFVGLRPVRPCFHRAIPALEVRELRETAMDHFGERNHSRAKVVGDRDVVAAHVFLAGPQQMGVEDVEPELRALLPPLNGPLCASARTLVMREDLWINEAIAEVAMKPVLSQSIISLTPRALQVLRIRRRVDLSARYLRIASSVKRKSPSSSTGRGGSDDRAVLPSDARRSGSTPGGRARWVSAAKSATGRLTVDTGW